MAEGFDIAMQNFTQNTLRGMGTGGNTASGSGEFALFKDMDLWEEAKQLRKVMPVIPTYGTLGKLMEGMQGTASGMSPSNMMTALAPPIPVGAGSKVPGIFNKKSK